jgi:hypothetical protein
MLHLKTLSKLLLWRVEHMLRKRFPTFSFATFNNEWISLSLEMACTLWWMLSLLTPLSQIWCIEHHQQQHMQQWWLFKRKHSHMLNEHKAMISFPLLLRHMGVSFLFWFIFYHLCIDHYRVSSTIFFSPLDVCFLLLITHVHNLTMCTSHNDFSTGCCTWSRFLIFFTNYSQCTSITSWFVEDDSSFS